MRLNLIHSAPLAPDRAAQRRAPRANVLALERPTGRFLLPLLLALAACTSASEQPAPQPPADAVPADAVPADADAAPAAAFFAPPRAQRLPPPGPDVIAAAHAPGADAAVCASCHVPGSFGQTRAAGRGALRYIELGCVACHAPPGSDRPAFAPDHLAVGFLGEARLREQIRHPEARNRETIMPAFALDDVAAGEVVAWLASRRGHPLPAPAAAQGTCSTCHDATPTSGASHACLFIEENRDELRCERCHETPPGPGRCDFVDAQRPFCTICHEADPDGTP